MSFEKRKRKILEQVQDEEMKKFSLTKEIISWVQIIAAAALIAFFLNTFIIANSRIPTASMENTIMAGSRVIGFRLSYLFGEPEREDIIIFHFPDNEKDYYVKRIIGLPGETVRISEGRVYINDSGIALDEPYLKEAMLPEREMEFTVPEGAYFVLGDNRNGSVDARYWNNKYVYKEKIVAKVLFQYFPKIRWIK